MTTETLITSAATEPAAPAGTPQPATPTSAAATPAAADTLLTATATATEQTAPVADKPIDAAATKEVPQGAPEKYEFKPQEGNAFDEAVIGKFSEVAKELNLSQDNAQKVLDKMSPVLAARQAEAITALRSEWVTSAKADPEFGGAKLTENMAVAKQALDTFGSPELNKLLNESGLGNHPEIIRAFYRAGKAIAEDTFVAGRRSDSGDVMKNAAQILYK